MYANDTHAIQDITEWIENDKRQLADALSYANYDPNYITAELAL